VGGPLGTQARSKSQLNARLLVSVGELVASMSSGYTARRSKVSFAPTARHVPRSLSPKNFMDYGGTLKDGTNPWILTA